LALSSRRDQLKGISREETVGGGKVSPNGDQKKEKSSRLLVKIRVEETGEEVGKRGVKKKEEVFVAWG